jgi:exosortase J
MSAFPDSDIGVQAVHREGLSSAALAALASGLSVLGLVTIWPAVATLWTLWTTDPTKSIGMAVPLVSLVLILRAWRTLGWRMEGTWWGMALLLPAMASTWLQRRAVLLMVLSPHWSTPLPPPSLVLLAYGSGVVLLFGGTRLFRAALFPVLLLLFANPVPHMFSLWVDLPLQAVSAHMARAFAADLGQHLAPDNLRLMFTPDFGMFIAPGCDGIRGSVTMGFIALIAGYVYRFRWYANALVVMGAILLGYVFNLARLCLLVLYYVAALHVTSLQNKAKGADYLIGGALFLVATLLLFAAIQRLREGPTVARAATLPDPGRLLERHSGKRTAQFAAMGALVLVAGAGLARTIAAQPSADTITDAMANRFPSQLGSYTLVRSWNETITTGQVVYLWAEYSPADGGTPVAIGVSPVFSWHDPLVCHTARGDSPLWQGQQTFVDGSAVAIGFNSALYSDGVTEYLEASTQCSGTSCGEFTTGRTHFGFVYSRPEPGSLLSGEPKRPIPVLVRVETVDGTMPAEAARQMLSRDLRAFLASVKLDELTRPYSR